MTSFQLQHSRKHISQLNEYNHQFVNLTTNQRKKKKSQDDTLGNNYLLC